MFRAASTSPATQAGPVLSTPIVQEASTYAPEQPKSVKDQLAEAFTVGSRNLDAELRKEEKE
jgi:hypothetical protein